METNKKRPTREEMIAYLKNLNEELGRQPTRKDLLDDMKQCFKIEFGKWCYALEAANIRIPSEKTIARRKRHKQKLANKDTRSQTNRDNKIEGN